MVEQANLDAGSSPLARGLPYSLVLPGVWRGIIPARAGFTRTKVSLRSATRDHPRSRGVYASKELWAKLAAGSSPLARGLRQRIAQLAIHRRIIPARAGFT